MTPKGETRRAAQQLARTLPPLLLAADRVARTVAAGIHGRRRAGPGDAFWQFRDYEPGDPASEIDWRQTAASDRVQIREREWEAAQSVALWVDQRAAMTWRSSDRVPAKAERGRLMLMALAALLLRGGERVGLLGVTPPMLGRAVLERLCLALDGATDAPPVGTVSPRSTIVLASDFLQPLDGVRRTVAALADAGGRGVLLQILDPAEEEFPFAGRVRFEAIAEPGHFLAGRAEQLRTPFQARLAAHRAGLGDIARAYGWTLLHHRTDHRPETALLAIHESLGADTGRRRGRLGTIASSGPL